MASFPLVAIIVAVYTLFAFVALGWLDGVRPARFVALVTIC